VNKFISHFIKAGAAISLATAVTTLATSLIFAVTANAATFKLINSDAAGIGFNDPTPATPIGLNNGKTVGEQRLIALNFVGEIWAKALGGDDVIEVLASFAPRRCTARQGVLASAGPFTVFRDFPNARFPKTWYHGALANRLAKIDLAAAGGTPAPQIIVTSNGDLGKTGCLEGLRWYYGLDDKAPLDGSSIDYVKTILHEYGHGLGFSSFADEETGELFDGFPSIWEHYILDNQLEKLWVNMTDAERKASAINNQRLAWTGSNSFAAAQQTLTAADTLDVFFFDRSGFALFPSGAANFGARGLSSNTSGPLGVLGNAQTLENACSPLAPDQVARVSGKIAVVSRGICAFTEKAKNVQQAGAIAIIIVDNVPSFAGRPSFGVDDPTVAITIPATLVSLQDGVRLRAGDNRFAAIYNSRRPAGTDLLGRPLLYAPTMVMPGSSVSHWDITATPNLLMEPNSNGDESISLIAPRDLTLPLLKDVGW
jgi:hypothetical protein